METEFKANVLFEFTSVAEAVGYLHAHGYDTVLEDAGLNHHRIMRGANGDLAIIVHEGLLDVKVYEDTGYWQDKLADWASDAPDFSKDYIMYLLTIIYRQLMTRIQCTSTNDETMDMLQYAADRNMFVSFVSIHAENFPARCDEELDRVDRFISEACFNERVRNV